MGIGAPQAPTPCPVEEAGEGLTYFRVGVGCSHWLWVYTSWGQLGQTGLPTSGGAACPASRKGLTCLPMPFLLCPVTAEADLPGQLSNFPLSAACWLGI